MKIHFFCEIAAHGHDAIPNLTKMKLNVKFVFLPTLLFVTFHLCSAQINDSPEMLPYSEIVDDKEEYNPGNIVSRMIDGLGYRYYWSTEGLTQNDLDYRPSDDSRDAKHTLEHIYGLSETILKAAKNEYNIRPANRDELSFEQLRSTTLRNLEKASLLFKNKSAKQLSALKVKFNNNGNKSEFPFWNMLNGPIADAIYHTGQIVSFRRSSGNPMNPNVNVFRGKTVE